MQNLNKHFATLDEFINECIKMCPIVDVKDNVVKLEKVNYKIFKKNFIIIQIESINIYKKEILLK